MTPPNLAEYDNKPLTATRSDSERCANPFCKAPITIKAQKGKRYCSDPCRTDAYALRRARALLEHVGIARFHVLLDEL